jgi:CO dehydrogenase maturation factor
MKTLAIAGKGGTGKTTIAALAVRWLSERAPGKVLAVDADSNVNLNDLLGVEIKSTIGAVREEMKDLAGKLPGGMTKQQFLEYKIQTCLVEAPSFDLIAMGRPEGPGCYCYANNLLREILAALNANYHYIVIDNEAGMEHLSRRTAQRIDYLLVVSDPTPRGIRTASRISRLLAELEDRVSEKWLVVNRVSGSLPDSVLNAITEEGLNLLAAIPEDEELLRLDRENRPITELSRDSKAAQAVGQFLQRLNLH